MLRVPATLHIPDYLFTEPVSYIIFQEGGKIYAKNGKTGQIEFQGTDAGAVIQSAIDNLASAGGGKILLKIGVYETDKPIYNKPYVSLIGEGMSRTIIRAKDTWSGGALIYNHGSYSVIEGITFDGNNIVDTVYQQSTSADYPDITNVTIRNCEFMNQAKGTWLFSVWDAYSKNFRVKNVWVEDCYFHDAISGGDIAAFSWVQYIYFRNNYVEHYTQSFNFYIVKDAVIEGNVFRDAQQTIAVSLHGERIKFTNNIIDAPVGIRVRPNAGYGKDIIVKGNTVIGGGYIIVDAYEHDLEEIKVIDNTVYNASSYGIYVVSGSATKYKIVNSIIKGNRVLNSFAGMTFNYLYDSQVVDNYVALNQRHGVVFYDSHHIIFHGNIIKNNSQESPNTYDGLRLVGGSDYIDVVDNQIYDDQATPTQRYGIYFYNTDYHRILENYFAGNVSGAMNTSPTNTVVKRNQGYVTENSGTATITGDGVTTTFTVDITHGLVDDKVAAKITLDRAGSVDKVYLVDTDADGFYETLRVQVTYDTAPADGETVPIYWSAEVA